MRTAATRSVLEGFMQCSKSHLWKLMMSFYDRKGIESWSQGVVPHFITCNAFIGRSYAKVLHGYLSDGIRAGAKTPVDPSEPLYIIELGAGSGKFSFYMLKALDEMKTVCDFPWSEIVYVMTDFTRKNFEFWQNHPSLRPYFESGRLDAGIFDAVNDSSITLWKSGKVLSAGTSVNPVCIVANYLFDTLYHDIFQVKDGTLHEGLVSTGSKNPTEPDPLEPDIIGRLDNIYEYHPISTRYYTDEEGDEVHFERILGWYEDYFGSCSEGASLLLPLGALRALRRLVAFSSGRAIVISGDKGNNNPEQFKGLMDPHIAVHGSFSLMVNYHAIGSWFTSRGGFALHNPQEEASLKVSCFVLTEPQGVNEFNDARGFKGSAVDDMDVLRAGKFPFLCSAFQECVDSFGPNDFFVMQKTMKEDYPNPPLRSVVSLLKLGDWDPDVFFKFRDLILNQAPTCGQKLKNDLSRGVRRVWENYYAMDSDKDIAFEIGRYYYGIHEYERALHFYSISTSTIGEHHVTYHNQGLCNYSLNRPLIALENFKKAMKMNASYEKARNWHDKVIREIQASEKPMNSDGDISHDEE